MNVNVDSVLQPVADYYSDKVRAYGSTPRGVDWNSAESQKLRFDNLLRILPESPNPIVLDDYGCGYGALLDHLRTCNRGNVDYLGLDISASMIAEASARHPEASGRFHHGTSSLRLAEFAVASGIFNVRLTATIVDWEKHIVNTLEIMNAGTTRGFAFNCLTSYSDLPKRQSYLYYGDPCYYFDLCKRRYGCNVALLHDYGLYEFTLLVRKEP
jgi:SAM-dependent methyltransferase